MKHEKFIDSNFEEDLGSYTLEERLIRFKDLLQSDICEMDIRIDPEANSEFAMKMSMRRSNEFTVAILSGSGHALVRSANHIASDGSDDLLFIGNTIGEVKIRTGDQELVVCGDDLAIIDLSKPCVLKTDSQSAFGLTMLKVPRAAAELRLSQEIKKINGTLVKDSCLGIVLNETFNVIAREAMSLEFSEYGKFINTFLDLAGMSFGMQCKMRTEETKDGHFGLRLAIQRYVDANLRNAELNHGQIATHFGISVRQVHKVFEGKGITIGQYILNRRLQGAASHLRAIDHAHRKIGEIAFDWCFNELSHFSRAFKTHYGCTARQWRHNVHHH